MAAHLYRVEAKMIIVDADIYPKLRYGMDFLNINIPIVVVTKESSAKLPPEVLDFKYFTNLDGKMANNEFSHTSI